MARVVKAPFARHRLYGHIRRENGVERGVDSMAKGEALIGGSGVGGSSTSPSTAFGRWSSCFAVE
jgi:hypothetical protein